MAERNCHFPLPLSKQRSGGAAFTTQGTHILDAGSRPGPQCGNIMITSPDPFGNRTRDLPACSAVPQPPAPPRARKARAVPQLRQDRFLLQPFQLIMH